jgi:hypothetical protein
MVVFNFILSVHLIGSCVKKFMQLYSLLLKDYYNHIRPCSQPKKKKATPFVETVQPAGT